MDKEPILLVFLDLRELYGNLDCVRLLNILERYGVDPKMQDMLEDFWERQEVVIQKIGTMAPSLGKLTELHRGV